MILSSHNEWGRLRSVVVGRADNARVPVDDTSLRAINYAGARPHGVVHGPYPATVIDEANEDLEYLCEVFVRAGVTVYRPEVPDTAVAHGAGRWHSDGYYAFCPRDGLLVVGDTVIEAPMVLRARYTDAFPYRRNIRNDDRSVCTALLRLVRTLCLIESSRVLRKEHLTVKEYQL